MTVLAEACDDLAQWLPVAGALITEPDTDTATAHGQPGSAPPWNNAAASAVMTAHEGIRRLEASIRLAVTGHPGRARGGSDANTTAALTAITSLGYALTADGQGRAAMFLVRLTTVIRQLPAVDEAERWQRVRAGPDGVAPQCAYCGMSTLRVAVRSGLVTCLYPGCADGDGRHPVGVMTVGRLSGEPCIAWADGLIQVPPNGTETER